MPTKLKKGQRPKRYPEGIDWLLSEGEQQVLAYFYDQVLAGEGMQYEREFNDPWILIPKNFLVNSAQLLALEDLLIFGMLYDPKDINWGYDDDSTNYSIRAISVLQNHITLTTLGGCVARRLREAGYLPKFTPATLMA